MSWEGAIVYCTDLVESGHTDWRLPTYVELKSLRATLSATVWTADIHWTNYVICNRMAYSYDTSGNLPSQYYGAGNCRDSELFRAVCIR